MRGDPMKQSIWSKVPCFTKTGTFTGSIVRIEETDMGIAKLFFKPDRTSGWPIRLTSPIQLSVLGWAGWSRRFPDMQRNSTAVGRASVSALSGNCERGVFDLSYRPDHRWGRKACLQHGLSDGGKSLLYPAVFRCCKFQTKKSAAKNPVKQFWKFILRIRVSQIFYTWPRTTVK